MCGIAGYVLNRLPLSKSVNLLTMRDALQHRGPDDAGALFMSPSGVCRQGDEHSLGFGQRRLSIIDLSPAGHQPMSNEDGSVWICYNGEFYDFAAYRDELVAAGHTFRSHCDTETIIHLYEQYGIEETLRRINGMFAFALWDQKKGKLFLARDRAGKKPLYYHHAADGSIYFASEMKGLLATGLIRCEKVDPLAFDECWTFGASQGDRTIYEDIRSIRPGCYAVWKGGNVEHQRFWTCPFAASKTSSNSLDALADELDSLLANAIRLRLFADVPVGLFLSGGVDSSLIAAITARHVGTNLSAFTIAFREDDYNEAPHARAVAEALGLKHHTLVCDEDMEPSFEKIARHFDEPFGDSSCIPTYFVSKTAREHVTVVLTGDAGDELFGGYPWYLEGLRLWGSVKLPERKDSDLRDWLWRRKLMMLGERAGYARLLRQLSSAGRKAVFTPDFLGRVASRDAMEARISDYPALDKSDCLNRMQRSDCMTYLPNDILVKVDRMSMSHALECRNPFLDRHVVEFAARLPVSAKIGPDGRGKYILRHLLKRYLPESLYERPKRGFSVPFNAWCVGKVGDCLRERWRGLRHEFLNPSAADVLFPRQGKGSTDLQWTAFSTLTWLDQHSR